MPDYSRKKKSRMQVIIHIYIVAQNRVTLGLFIYVYITGDCYSYIFEHIMRRADMRWH